MKKILLFLLIFTILFSSHAFSAVTTSDGVITLDFYEDSQSGIPNRWILDFTVNDIGYSQYSSILFEMRFLNTSMDFDNIYNQESSLYVFGHEDHFFYEYPIISSDPIKLIPTDAGSNYLFYSLPEQAGEFMIGIFNIDILYIDTLSNTHNQLIQLTGPVGFYTVPEPISIVLFLLGSFFLKIFIQRK